MLSSLILLSTLQTSAMDLKAGLEKAFPKPYPGIISIGTFADAFMFTQGRLALASHEYVRPLSQAKQELEEHARYLAREEISAESPEQRKHLKRLLEQVEEGKTLATGNTVSIIQPDVDTLQLHEDLQEMRQGRAANFRETIGATRPQLSATSELAQATQDPTYWRYIRRVGEIQEEHDPRDLFLRGATPDRQIRIERALGWGVIIAGGINLAVRSLIYTQTERTSPTWPIIDLTRGIYYGLSQDSKDGIGEILEATSTEGATHGQ